MQRRNFLKLPLAAAALAMVARADETKTAAEGRAGAGIRVGGRKNRRDEDLTIMGGRFDLKVSTQDSGGELLIYDTVRTEKGGPALHRHLSQDEWFYVIRGEFVVQVGTDTFNLSPGDSAFAPRKVPHAFAYLGGGEGQLLVLFQPAGSMEDFFTQMSKLGKDAPKNQDAAFKRLWQDHGMEILGPPLKI